MALYGYARVSTSDQDFTLQEHARRAAERAIEILEPYGVATAQGLLRAPPGGLQKRTIKSY